MARVKSKRPNDTRPSQDLVIREPVTAYSAASPRQDKPAALTARFGSTDSERIALIDEIRKGIRIESFDELSRALGITAQELAAATDLNPRTLARRKKEGYLHADESDRVSRVAMLFERAVELFEGEKARAAHWFTTPRQALAGASPLALCDTWVGVQEVQDLIGRLEHGVFA
ncbi:MAG: antitoxin Xre-like helix-turn-helix domain-containing protein [Thiotrichales bacterium]